MSHSLFLSTGPKRINLILLVASVVGWLIPIASAQTLQTEKRVLTPADIVGRTGFAPSDWSPDGKILAFVQYDPGKETRRVFSLDSLYSGGDIWIANASDGVRRRVSGGETDVSYWLPKWSPDGKRIAFLSTKGNNAHVWVWEKSSGRTREISSRPVNIPYWTLNHSPFIWKSNREIICSFLPPGEISNSSQIGDLRTTELVTREWQKSIGHGGVAVSVLESGVTPRQNPGALVAVDVISGRERTLWNEMAFDPSLSPDKKYIAFFAKAPLPNFQPIRPADVPIWTNRPGNLVVADLSGRVVARDPNVLSSVTSFVWSPDSSKLAFIGTPTDSDDKDATLLHVVDITKNEAVPVGDISKMQIRSLNWASRELLALCSPIRSLNKGYREYGQLSWFVISESGGFSKIEGNQSVNPPEFVFLGPDGKSVLGVSAGLLWRIDPARLAYSTVRIAEAVDMEYVMPAVLNAKSGMPTGGVIVSSSGGGKTNYFQLDLRDNHTHAIDVPSSEAKLLAYSETSGTALFSENPLDTFSAWFVTLGSLRRPVSLYANQNAFLKNVEVGKTETISYYDLDGIQQYARVVLPPIYQQGRKYPLVVEVYPGRVFNGSLLFQNDNSLSKYSEKDEFGLNLQLLAAQGYVVLEPSMPLKPSREGGDYLGLQKGVMPAIDALIETGLVDSRRIGLLGHSYGAYAAVSLISQTNRFRAAVAIEGVYDLISAYGTFKTWARYTTAPENDPESWVTVWGLETAQPRLGGPPWDVTDEYVRNSPLFYADKIDTPLMLVHGDLDDIPMEQSEEMYFALHKLGKRCEFVRYWGGNHTIDWPSQIEDMWGRIGAWFGQNLAAGN